MNNVVDPQSECWCLVQYTRQERAYITSSQQFLCLQDYKLCRTSMICQIWIGLIKSMFFENQVKSELDFPMLDQRKTKITKCGSLLFRLYPQIKYHKSPAEKKIYSDIDQSVRRVKYVLWLILYHQVLLYLDCIFAFALGSLKSKLPFLTDL